MPDVHSSALYAVRNCVFKGALVLPPVPKSSRPCFLLSIGSVVQPYIHTPRMERSVVCVRAHLATVSKNQNRWIGLSSNTTSEGAKPRGEEEEEEESTGGRGNKGASSQPRGDGVRASSVAGFQIEGEQRMHCDLRCRVWAVCLLPRQSSRAGSTRVGPAPGRHVEV